MKTLSVVSFALFPNGAALVNGVSGDSQLIHLNLTKEQSADLKEIVPMHGVTQDIGIRVAGVVEWQLIIDGNTTRKDVDGMSPPVL
jgi:hypothetical protein